MATLGICRGGGQARLIGLAGLHRGGDGIVDFQDDAFGAVVAFELGLVLALHDGEGVQDVGHGGAGRGERLGQGGGLLPPLGLRAEVGIECGAFHILSVEYPTASPSRAGSYPRKPVASLEERLCRTGNVR